MNCSKASKPVVIEMNIGDQLTTISCGHVVVELIKFIAYQRQQIPYNYSWLKQIVNKKKAFNENEAGELKESYQSERHFRAASTALENLDLTLKSLLQEISGSTSVIPEEVCIALGSTPVTCKEVYRLIMPDQCHQPQCHSTLIASDQKIQRNVFRTLVTAENLNQVFFNPLPPTNLYVFIKKRLIGAQESVVNTDTFLHTNGCRIPRNSKIVVIDFRSPNQAGVSCCNSFEVFGVQNTVESRNCTTDDDDLHEIESTDTAKWYQSSYIMKGFQDCVVNGSSVTNTWSS